MNRQSIVALVFAVVGAAVVLPELGCGCTEAGCVEVTIIDVQADEWPDGQYVFTTVADGQTRTCTLDLPATSGGTACVNVDDLDVEPSVAGVPLRVRFQGAVELVHFTLEKDGAVVVDTDLKPEKGDKYYPNGRLCGPTCQSTLTAVSVSF